MMHGQRNIKLKSCIAKLILNWSFLKIGAL